MLALLFHSYLWTAVSLILIGVGFFELKLTEPVDSRWFRFVRSMVEWEKNWAAYPWTWRKSLRFAGFILLTLAVIWALWAQDVAVLLLIAALAGLAYVAFLNKTQGIDP